MKNKQKTKYTNISFFLICCVLFIFACILLKKIKVLLEIFYNIISFSVIITIIIRMTVKAERNSMI